MMLESYGNFSCIMFPCIFMLQFTKHVTIYINALSYACSYILTTFLHIYGISTYLMQLIHAMTLSNYNARLNHTEHKLMSDCLCIVCQKMIIETNGSYVVQARKNNFRHVYLLRGSKISCVSYHLCIFVFRTYTQNQVCWQFSIQARSLWFLRNKLMLSHCQTCSSTRTLCILQ